MNDVMRQAAESRTEAYKPMEWLAGVFVALGAAALILGLVTYCCRLSNTSEQLTLSEYGDFTSGTLGTAAAFSASLFVIATLLFQRIELGLQREELKKAVKIAADQERQMSDSVDEQRQQSKAALRSLELTQSQTAFSHLMALLPQLRSLADEIPQQEFDDLDRRLNASKNGVSATRPLRKDQVDTIRDLLKECESVHQKVNALREAHLLFGKLKGTALTDEAFQIPDMKPNLDALMRNLSFSTAELDRRNNMLKVDMIPWCKSQLNRGTTP